MANGRGTYGRGRTGNPPRARKTNGKKKPTPTPGMLGSGLAAKAGKAIRRRQRMLRDL